ncbi:MAG: DinB family protein [Ilumatobacteraceae bacterium]
MTVAWNTALVDQLDWHWSNFVRPHLDGLDDARYLWEPVPGCWSIRRREDATGPFVDGPGDTVLDDQWPPPDPPPVTTIAWRMAHIAIGVFGQRAVDHFGADGLTELPREAVDWPITAAGGLALLDHWYGAWITGGRALGDDGLAHPCGPAAGPYAAEPLATLVLHVNREALHHGAEILLLLDLYRHTGGVALR